ncbi:peptidoglycan DD-metalloendopeptidase family protein, partial [Candidatus Parcubacteria bacterium]|nr:peptidoglycan DD-metalloendopeptidase family protein [Candidatus Parcubacteria bacterium]
LKIYAKTVIWRQTHINYYKFRQFNKKKTEKFGYILGIGASFLIYIIKFLIVLSGIFWYLFSFAIVSPLRRIIRFLFYKIIVKVYSFYLSFLNKIGWSGLRDNFFKFLFNQKLVHVFVVCLTVFVIFVNLSSKTRAGEISDRAKKTMLIELVNSEFGEFEEMEELIIETLDKDVVVANVPMKYIKNFNVGLLSHHGLVDDKKEDLDISNGEHAIIETEPTEITKAKDATRSKIVTYKVKSGDSISTIAEEFSISVNTVLWENSLTAYSVIRPGDELSILPVSGVTHEVKSGENLSFISTKYDIGQSEILKINKLASASRLSIGQQLIIPGGSVIRVAKPKIASSPKTVSGYTAIKNFVTAPSTKSVAGNKMLWPTTAKRITQYYSWRHKGLDIADRAPETPLFAADAGVIEESGWRRGYGYQVLINHGGGKKTRYAHASKLFVKKGDKVSRGQTIAYMGSTGWSTGPHIHFEVIINGTKYNPLHYIK